MSKRPVTLALAWLSCAVVALRAHAQTAYTVKPRVLPALKPAYGHPAYGLSLGLSFNNELPAEHPSVRAYITLQNTGTSAVFLLDGGPATFHFVGVSLSGKRALLKDIPESQFYTGGGFLSVSTMAMDPGVKATLAANLSRTLVVPEPGQYEFLVSARMTISTLIPPTKESMQEIELISGPVSFDVPASMVYTNTGKHPSSAVSKPVSESFIDPNIARTDVEKKMIQRANETRTNEFRQHWPWLLGEAPFPTNATNGALSPAVPPALAVAPSLDDGRKRWWLAGIAAACAAGIGFIILRRRRSGPQR